MDATGGGAETIPVGLLAMLVICGALATARLTRLVVQDEITKELRNGILRRLQEENRFHLKMAYFLTCQWCVSIWVGAAVGAANLTWPTAWWWWLALSTMAGSQITGMLGEISSYLRSRDDK